MKHSSRWLGFGLAAVTSLAMARVAQAHPGHYSSNALIGGVLHPLLGPDHLLAAIASGLLAVRIGTRRALWIIPASFVGLMLLGGGLAAIGFPLPQAEWGIALSVIVLGLLVAMVPSVPTSAAAGLAGLFALCHGHAHVAEFTGQSLIAYVTGFSIATLALHVAAIAAGLLMVRAGQPRMIRFAGAAIALGFVFILAA